MKATLMAVRLRAEGLSEKAGLGEPELAAIQFYIQRAIHTLEKALYTYPPAPFQIREGLVNLAAVCVLEAEAIRTLPPQKEAD